MAPQNFQLVMRSGPTPGQTYELTVDEITIGREVNNTIIINDAEVSRRHTRLVAQSGGYMIEDMGSTNGTFVNGQRLMGPHVLTHGELVSMGENVSLVFESPHFDQNATLISGAAVSPPTPLVHQMPQTVPAPPPPVQQPYPADGGFSGNVPPGPVEPAYIPPQPVPEFYEEPYEESKSSRTWLFAGAGCLVVLLCVLVIGAVAFDFLDLYCVSPFDGLFNCPP